MARYRRIDVRMWTDEKFRRLSPLAPSGQALWIYLLTNPETTCIPGLYRAGEAGLAEALAWPLKQFRELFQELSEQGLVKASWEDRLVWIPNVIQYNAPANPNTVKSWRVPWDEMPECELKAEAFQVLKSFVEPLGEGFAKAFQEQLAERLGEPLRKRYGEYRDRDRDRDRDRSRESQGDSLPVSVLPFTPNDLATGYNECVSDPYRLPKVTIPLTPSRAKHAARRIREHPGIEWWNSVFGAYADSKFLRGEGGREGWRGGCFDFLVANPENAVKVYEGAYADTSQAGRGG